MINQINIQNNLLSKTKEEEEVIEAIDKLEIKLDRTKMKTILMRAEEIEEEIEISTTEVMMVIKIDPNIIEGKETMVEIVRIIMEDKMKTGEEVIEEDLVLGLEEIKTGKIGVNINKEMVETLIERISIMIGRTTGSSSQIIQTINLLIMFQYMTLFQSLNQKELNHGLRSVSMLESVKFL